MKKSGKIIVPLFFLLFGLMTGSYLSGDVKAIDESFGVTNREAQTQEVAELRKANEDMEKRIAELAGKVDAYEKEWATENIVLNKLMSDVSYYKMLAGHSAVTGSGIRVVLESRLGDNIAVTVEREKFLLTLVNELRFFGAEMIAINGQRLTARSEIGHAGNHINVNGVAIAPPYEILAIGNVRSFQRYVEHGTFLFEMMGSHGIQSSISYETEILLPGLVREKPIEFLKVVQEPN